VIGRTYRLADAVVAVSNGVADDLAAFIGLPRDRIQTIYNPVVPANIEELASEPVSHPWFLPGGPPVVMGAGRLRQEKDFPTLVCAFARVRKERPARLVIFGESGYDSDPAWEALLMKLAGELGVADDVSLLGWTANLFAYMARAAVFVLSSRWEGLSNVLIEAMACGCPVVSTDCPSGPREILDGGRFGRLVPVGDDLAMAHAIHATLASHPNRQILQDRAACFSTDGQVKPYLELLSLR
jgi:glycosyltransferase involved in cell wall biosynthesis